MLKLKSSGLLVLDSCKKIHNVEILHIEIHDAKLKQVKALFVPNIIKYNNSVK